ncbi:MAG: hypothetical protein MUP48_06600 [Wolbachia endosymbiont of Homalodisca vitripennis]|nr:hypothetical protein [Wolbachia endosymbiont of Homalodisca vitripennis]MCJ7455076.1 hypothetical protein [Wolbachia endosymbiont of Homalodisca vitripennis]MCJ7476241.1 hypothetical protein [Wolbachia endosymbiont of Homalodisca vitripennis]
MPIFKNHCGQFHKTNTALVALTSLYVIGAAVALSAPYWVSSTCTLAPLAAFAATPLGIGVLAFVAVALVGLAISAISKNNEISELKAPKIVIKDDKVMLQVTKEVYEDIKANNQNKNEKGEVIKDEYRISFSLLAGKDYYVTGKFGDGKAEFGDIVSLDINSLAKKNDKGEYVPISDNKKQLEELGLNKEENKGVNTYLGSLIVEQVASEQKAKN